MAALDSMGIAQRHRGPDDAGPRSVRAMRVGASAAGILDLSPPPHADAQRRRSAGADSKR
jgi:hypothetical protein